MPDRGTASRVTRSYRRDIRRYAYAAAYYYALSENKERHTRSFQTAARAQRSRRLSLKMTREEDIDIRYEE